MAFASTEISLTFDFMSSAEYLAIIIISNCWALLGGSVATHCAAIDCNVRRRSEKFSFETTTIESLGVFIRFIRFSDTLEKELKPSAGGKLSTPGMPSSQNLLQSNNRVSAGSGAFLFIGCRQINDRVFINALSFILVPVPLL